MAKITKECIDHNVIRAIKDEIGNGWFWDATKESDPVCYAMALSRIEAIVTFADALKEVIDE